MCRSKKLQRVHAVILAGAVFMEGRAIAERFAASIAVSVVGASTNRDVFASTRDVVGSRSAGCKNGLAHTCKQALEHPGTGQTMEVAR